MVIKNQEMDVVKSAQSNKDMLVMDNPQFALDLLFKVLFKSHLR